MTPTRHAGCPGTIRRRGFALPAAVVALAVLSLFLAGSAFFAMQEVRAARGGLAQLAALEAADYGAVGVLRDWDTAWNAGLSIGATLGPWTHALAGGASAIVRLTRLGPTTFWVASEGSAGGPSAAARDATRRVVGALFRLDIPNPDLRAALTVRDSARVLPGGAVVGDDSTDGSWLATSCALSVSGARAGVAAPDTARICDGSCGGRAGGIAGAPPLLADTAARDPARYAAAGGAWAAVTRQADIVLPAGATVTPAPLDAAGTCVRSRTDNWGSLVGGTPCAGYFPVIWARGDVTVAGGEGQGILIADGDVRLRDGARFQGLIVARDDFEVLSGGATVLGAVLAGDARPGAGDHSAVGLGGLVRASSCALSRAWLGSSRPQRVRDRWWSELF